MEKSMEKLSSGTSSSSLLLIMSDIMVFSTMVYFAIVTATFFGSPLGFSSPAALEQFLVLAPCFVISGALAGLYDWQTYGSYLRMAASVTLALVLALVGWLALPILLGHAVSHAASGVVPAPLSPSYRLQWICFAILAWTVAVSINRRSLAPVLFRRAAPQTVLVLGGDAQALKTRLYVRQNSNLNLQPCDIATFAAPDRPEADPLRIPGLRAVVVMAAAWDRVDHVRLMALRDRGVEVMSEVEFIERQRRRVDPHQLSCYGVMFCPGLRNGPRGAVFRRLFDIVFSLLLLALTAPLLLITAIAIKLESPGPIFYRQTRIGFLGRLFEIIKFRSMRCDAEKPGEAIWACCHDPRITSVGRIIRLFRIDELPQLINVLRGEMSVIGPRPERPEFVKILAEQIDLYTLRHSLKPGITGWAQVNYPYGASVEDAQIKLEYDLYYIKNRSFMIDLAIIFSTIRVVLRWEGAR